MFSQQRTQLRRAVIAVLSIIAAPNPASVNIPFYLGLLIATPALWLHRGLSAEVELLLHETNRMALSIIDQIDSQMQAIDNRKDDGALFGS